MRTWLGTWRHRWQRLLVVALLVAGVSSCDDTADDTFRVNAGGPAVESFGGDAYFVGGTAASTVASIVTGGVIDPAPAAVYQTARTGASTYTLSGLSAGGSVRVRLHFAEFVHGAVGLRRFHVQLNGVQVLTNFDVFQAAGGMNRAVVREFTTGVNGTGEVKIHLLAGAAGTPTIGGIEILAPHQIDAGGTGAAPFVADAFVAGGFTETDPAAIDRSGVTDPAPDAVYHTVRWAPHTYTLPSLTPGARYRLRLHFVEIAFNAAGLRRFNVAVNSVPVLTNFDIFAEAGGRYRALVKEFRVQANASGQVVVALTIGASDFPALAGLEIASEPVHQVNAGGTAVAPYGDDAYFAGACTDSTTNTISIAGVIEPAPAAVYQTARCGDFAYTVPNLQPGAGYRVRLHFAEFTYSAAGQRKFNVVLNGVPVLLDFDVFKALTNIFDPVGMNEALVRDFFTRADANGRIEVQFSNGSAGIPILNALEVALDPLYRVDAGGAVVYPFSGDGHAIGGTPVQTAATIDVTGVVNAAPTPVYQAARQGAATYTIGNLLASFSSAPAYHKVRLHFAEIVHASAGQRRFNVAINGTPVLTEFDVRAVAGASNRALVKEFTVLPNPARHVVVALSAGSIGEPLLNGLEVARLGGESWPEADALFHRDPRWRGADGAYSIPLGGSRFVWAFGDSFVDLTPPYARVGSKFVRNTLAIQQGSNPELSATTFTGKWKVVDGVASDFFPPPVEGYWYWGGPGAVVNGRLVMFLNLRAPPGAFGTVVKDVALTVDNYTDDPDNWNLVFNDIPQPPSFTGRIEPQTVLHEDGALYVWGDGFPAGCGGYDVFLWKFDDADIAAGDFTKAQYWTGSGFTPWTAMSGNPTAVAAGAGGFTVHKDAAGKYVAIDGRACSARVSSRTATSREGPWSPFAVQFQPPDAGWSHVTAVHLWKAHPWLGGVPPGLLPVTYSVNGPPSFTDESIYYPRFARLVAP